MYDKRTAEMVAERVRQVIEAAAKDGKVVVIQELTVNVAYSVHGDASVPPDFGR